MPRHQHLLAATVGVLLAVALGSAVPAVVGSPQAAAAAARAERPGRPVACHAPAPRTASGYQRMFDAKNDRTWAGGDQAATVSLPHGRTLWLFGDTIQGRRVRGGGRSADSRYVHNSLLVQTGGCLSAVPAAAEVVPSRPDGQWYWPQSGVVTGNRLVLLCARVQRTGPGPFDFRTTGVDAAVFDLASGTPRFQRMVVTPSSRSSESGDQYGKAVLRQGRWLYLYGTRQEAGSFGRQVRAARVPVAKVLDPRAWTYWTGAGWSPSPASAVPVASGWSTAFSVWTDRHGHVRTLTKLQDVYGENIVTAKAAGAVGHFRGRPVLSAPTRGGVLLYNALAHPELPLDGGGVLVSVCRGSADLTALWADTSLYKPQFATIAS